MSFFFILLFFIFMHVYVLVSVCMYTPIHICVHMCVQVLTEARSGRQISLREAPYMDAGNLIQALKSRKCSTISSGLFSFPLFLTYLPALTNKLKQSKFIRIIFTT